MRTAVCEWCREEFPAVRSTARYCSERHRHAAFRLRRQSKLQDARWAEGYVPCDGLDCEEWISPAHRRDRRFCSNACRQKEYRDNKAMREDLEGLRYLASGALRVTGNTEE